MAADPQMPTSRKTKTNRRRINPNIGSQKHNGALHELSFMVECMKRGWKVCVPIGEDSRYDVIVDTSKGLSRVQVKTSSFSTKGVFRFRAYYGKNVKKSYTWKDCDIIAAYVVPLNTWWIIPIKDLRGNNLNLSKKYHEFNSAWHLIGNENKYHKRKQTQ
jgi:hypothetical protein